MILVAGLVLFALVPARAAEAEKVDEDPWIGKTRAEVVELLGKPQKAKRSGRDGEKLTYKFLRLNPSGQARLDVELISVPGVGIVAKPTKLGSGPDSGLAVRPTEYDEHGRPNSGGEEVSMTFDKEKGKLVPSDSEASTGLGKVKLFLILDAEGRVTEWSVSGKK